MSSEGSSDIRKQRHASTKMAVSTERLCETRHGKLVIGKISCARRQEAILVNNPLPFACLFWAQLWQYMTRSSLGISLDSVQTWKVVVIARPISCRREIFCPTAACIQRGSDAYDIIDLILVVFAWQFFGFGFRQMCVWTGPKP